jgi:hypothetical protein
MQTLAETGAARRALPGATWAAAALSASASLLHWIATDTDTHSWSADAVIGLIAGAGLMALAMALVARPWGARTTRALYLIGAVGTAVVVMAFLLPLLSGVTSGHVDNGGHAGHDVNGDGGIVTLDAARMSVQVALVGVLVWMHRVTGRPDPEVTEAAG